MAEVAGGPSGAEGAEAPQAAPEAAPVEKVEAAPEVAPRKIAPIKDKAPKGLPGVISKNEPFLNDLGRDEKGRFAPSRHAQSAKDFEEEMHGPEDDGDHDGAPGEVGEPVVKAAPPLPGPEVTPPPPSKFKFAGEEFEDVSKAEQQFKTLRGMYKPLNEAKAKAESERDYGYQAAESWMGVVKRAISGELSDAEADQLAAQLKVQRRSQGQAQPAGQGSGGQAPRSAPQAGTPEFYRELSQEVDLEPFRILAANPDPESQDSALKYLVEEILRVAGDKIVPAATKKFEGQLTPFVEDRETNARAERIDRVMQTVGSYQDASGNVSFPELNDPEAIVEIGKIWAAHEFPFEKLEDPRSLINAVALYRMYNPEKAQGRPSPVSIPTPATGGHAAVTAPSSPAPGAAASVSDSSRGGGAGPARAAGSTQQQRLLHGLDRAQLLDPVLGFARRVPTKD